MFRACFGFFVRVHHSMDRAPRPTGDAPSDAPGPTLRTSSPCAGVRAPLTQPGRATGRSQGFSLPSSRQDVAQASLSTAPVTTGNGLNASRIQNMQPENVTVCDACNIMDGLRLQQQELGRGTYGVVVPGTYRGVTCAVKIMLTAGLDRTAIRELLLSPSLVHPNVISTFASRAAHLTSDFFDLLEGERGDDQGPNLPRVLAPIALKSDDGFGDPKGLNDGADPLVVLHQVLHALGAQTGKMVVIVVQEYCDRGTLDQAIRKNIFQPMPLWGVRLARRALLRTAAEIARGLLHLHDSGVVHGDLKPANVMLHSSKEDRRGFVAKTGDFGLSHVLPNGAVSSLTTDSWGSIAYMAPEAFDCQISRATDVWAFGVLLWEMLTGERPYTGCSRGDVVLGVKEDRLRLTWPEGAPMSAGIIELGRKCLCHDPDERPRFDAVIQGLVGIEREIRAELLAQQQQQQQREQQQKEQQQQQEEAHLEAAYSAPLRGSGNTAKQPLVDSISEIMVLL